MDNEPKLNSAEWEIVFELLDRERRTIPQEIRHAHDNISDQDHLRMRFFVVEGLLEKIQTLEAAQPPRKPLAH